MNSKRTVSDTKRAFFAAYTRPVNSIYRRVIDELLVENHLLVTNQDFRYDPIYATGLLTAFQAFMDSYSPADQREPILRSLLSALQLNYDQLQADAAQWRSLAMDLPALEVLEVMTGTREPGDGRLRTVRDTLTGIVNVERFKYSRLFGVGLMSLVDAVARAASLNEKERTEKLQQVCQYLKVDYTRLKRDMDIYTLATDRIKRAKEVVDDLVQADRRKREERAVSQST